MQRGIERQKGVTEPGSIEADPIALSSAADFLSRAYKAVELSELSQSFSAAVASLGFRHHLCRRVVDGNVEILFGAGPPAGFASTGGPEEEMSALTLSVTDSAGEECQIVLFGGSRPVDASTRARLEAMASIYLGFGEPLLECSADIPTSVGLGLTQRQCLKLALAGFADVDAAEILGISTLSMAKHIEHAARLLGVESRSQAVAIAAARGWLSGMIVSPKQQTRQ